LTLVPTVDGNILVGPSKVDTDGKNDAFPTSPEGLDELRALAGEVIPGLPLSQIIRSFGTLRPNPYWVRRDTDGSVIRDERSISSFVLHEADDTPAFLSLIGIKTPGLTCAYELGNYAADRMLAMLGGAAVNEAYNPTRQPPLRLAELSIDERTRLVRDNPAYGRIVCRCRGITEGEIIDSIRGYYDGTQNPDTSEITPGTRNAVSATAVTAQGLTYRSPRAVTVDGVKRRTGAGSGRCQGGFCGQRIIEILSRELGVPPEEICKDRPGSYMLGGPAHD
jgi:glycerol-3-phosphate dehydrogenase